MRAEKLSKAELIEWRTSRITKLVLKELRTIIYNQTRYSGGVPESAEKAATVYTFNQGVVYSLNTLETLVEKLEEELTGEE